MRSNQGRRLDALEQRKRASQGLRIFQQSWDDPDIYHEGIDNPQGEPFTQTEIDALGQNGWQCVVVKYVEKDIETA